MNGHMRHFQHTLVSQKRRQQNFQQINFNGLKVLAALRKSRILTNTSLYLGKRTTMHKDDTVLFCSFAVVDPTVGHSINVLSPFISVLCCSN